jgi:hypothetical protein
VTSGELLDWFGTAQPVAVPRRLCAGSLSCLLSEGAVRDVRWGDVEVLRGISYLFRDRDWGTPSASVAGIVVDESPDGFTVRFDLRIATSAGALNVTACIEGRSSGTLVFDVLATPDIALETNRCGFVILHPAHAAGRPLGVEHTDGRVEGTVFPREISPSQPVFDIRALAWPPCEGVQAECRLQADLPHDPAGKFEMEDQRNWSDASFKTYVASLLDPWPYVLPAGRSLRQRVSLRVTGQPPAAALANVEPLVGFGTPCSARMPQIGIGIPPGLHRASSLEVDALRELDASWWMVEAQLGASELKDDLAAVAMKRLGRRALVQLDMIVPDSLDPSVAAARAGEACDEAGLQVDAVRLLPASYLKSFQPSDRWPNLAPLEEYARAARASFPRARVGGGMFTYFTELNRKPTAAGALDFIGHATCPIVHAADDASVMQTMEALPHIVHSVHAAWPGLPYRLGPSAIPMRRNPYGTAAAENPRLERIALASVDPRHGARFGAAWLVAYAAAVAPAGLEVLGLLDSHGPRGPVNPSAQADSPERDRIVPAWSMLARLASAAGAAIVPIEGLPRQIAGIAWSHDGSTLEGLLASVSGNPCSLAWAPGIRARHGTPLVRVTLAPFETIRIAAQLPY